MVLLDLSKAFDRVCHEFLIAKLKAAAVDGVTVQWIQSFLSERTQAVRVYDSQGVPHLLSSITVLSGVQSRGPSLDRVSSIFILMMHQTFSRTSSHFMLMTQNLLAKLLYHLISNLYKRTLIFLEAGLINGSSPLMLKNVMSFILANIIHISSTISKVTPSLQLLKKEILESLLIIG